MGSRGAGRGSGLNALCGQLKVMAALIRLFYHTRTTDGVTYFLVRYPLLRALYVVVMERVHPRAPHSSSIRRKRLDHAQVTGPKTRADYFKV